MSLRATASSAVSGLPYLSQVKRRIGAMVAMRSPGRKLYLLRMLPHPGSLAAIFLVGHFTGTAFCQWLARIGTDFPFPLCVFGAGVIGLFAGQHLFRRTGSQSAGVMLGLAAAMAAVFPLTIDYCLTPLAAFADRLNVSWLLPIFLAAAIWVLPVCVWSASIFANCVQLCRAPAPIGRHALGVGLFCAVAGAVCSLFLTIPAIGGSVSTVIAALAAIGVGAWQTFSRNVAISAECASSAKFDGPGAVLDRRGQLASLVMLALCGFAFASVRMLQLDFALNTLVVHALSWIALPLGFALGLMWRSGKESGTVWSAVVCSGIAIWLGALVVVIGFETDVLLWVNTSLSSATLRFTIQAGWLTMTLLPVTVGCGLMIRLAAVRPRTGHAESTVTSFEYLPGCVAAILVGVVVAHLIVESSGVISTMVVLAAAGLLVLVPTLMTYSTGFKANGLVPAGAAVCVISFAGAMGGSVVTSSRSLFSAASLQAYRAGYGAQLVAAMDDSRQLLVGGGHEGSRSLWKQRGGEVVMRENGTIRGRLNSLGRLQPQPSVEVIQAVLPLVLVDSPQSVLLLGAHPWGTLATTVEFPVQTISVANSDSAWSRATRKVIDSAVGTGLLNDDRLKKTAASPVVSLATGDDKFQVILDSPPAGMLAAGACRFTAEYYASVAHRLSDDGIYCQRFETLDFGPGILGGVIRSLQQSFEETALVENGPGDVLLLATQGARSLARAGMLERAQTPQVRRCLARSGYDWSVLLNAFVYDHAALAEFANHVSAGGTAVTCREVAGIGWGLETLRWGHKQQEMAVALNRSRTSPKVHELVISNVDADRDDELETLGVDRNAPKPLREVLKNWIPGASLDPLLARRTKEVSLLWELIRENPETAGWEYRKVLKKQMQTASTGMIQQVAHSDGPDDKMHPDDRVRRNYLKALGDAASAQKPNLAVIANVQQYADPYDPMVTFFLHHEVAELCSRTEGGLRNEECRERLQQVFFSTSEDRSVRCVNEAIQLVAGGAAEELSAQDRYDVLNALMQQLYSRWDYKIRKGIKSARMTVYDVEASLQAVSVGLSGMDRLAADVPHSNWQQRSQVLERMLVRPLREYRGTLQETVKVNEAKTRQILQEAH